ESRRSLAGSAPPPAADRSGAHGRDLSVVVFRQTKARRYALRLRPAPVALARRRADVHGASPRQRGPAHLAFVRWTRYDTLRCRARRGGAPTAGTYRPRVVGGGPRVEGVVRVGDATCVCCRLAAAPGPAETVALIWRKVFPGDIRDMVLSTSRNGGKSFAPAS